VRLISSCDAVPLSVLPSEQGLQLADLSEDERVHVFAKLHDNTQESW
jgi:hypothetical protein